MLQEAMSCKASDGMYKQLLPLAQSKINLRFQELPKNAIVNTNAGHEVAISPHSLHSHLARR